MFTIGNIIALIITAVICIVLSVCISLADGDFSGKALAVCFIISAVLIVGIFGGVAWYNTHTASGRRALKDTKSELDNGIYREITITAEDGRQIFYYKGKVDIESNHTDNYIKFESEDGRRFIVYYGIQDTIVIEEFAQKEE